MKNYYLYLLLDLRKSGNHRYGEFIFNFEPFYVGISNRKTRLTEHLNLNVRYNVLKTGIIKKLKLLGFDLKQILFIYEINLSREEVILLEKKIISTIGRRDLNQGPLSNLTDGGDGIINVCGKTRKKISMRMIKNNPFKDKCHTDETKDKIRKTIGDTRKGNLNANYNHKWSEEQKNIHSIKTKEIHKNHIGMNNVANRPDVKIKIKESKLGNKNPNAVKWKIVDDQNNEFIIEGGIKRQLKETFNLSFAMFYKKYDDHVENKNGWKLYNLGKI